jgi:hypothetical protein
LKNLINVLLLFLVHCFSIFDPTEIKSKEKNELTLEEKIRIFNAFQPGGAFNRIICVGVNSGLTGSACKEAEIINRNACVSGNLSAGAIKYYRYYASVDEGLSMGIANSLAANATNCVATYKENILTNTSSSLSDLESNQSLTNCQAITSTTMKIGSFRCISVHSFCNSSFYLKLGNASSFTNVSGVGNSNLTLPTWSTLTASYTPIEGIGTPIIGDNTFWSIPIGFNFNYFGQTFTNFYASSNGLISFDSNSPENNDASNLFIFKTNAPPSAIAPWWTDLNLDCKASVQYSSSGSAGNRILTVQWKDVLYKTEDLNDITSVYKRLNFQVKIYETSNRIEFIYGHVVGNTVTSSLAAIGLKNTANANYVFINGFNGSSSDTTRLKYNSFPVSGTVYRFTP